VHHWYSSCRVSHHAVCSGLPRFKRNSNGNKCLQWSPVVTTRCSTEPLQVARHGIQATVATGAALQQLSNTQPAPVACGAPPSTAGSPACRQHGASAGGMAWPLKPSSWVPLAAIADIPACQAVRLAQPEKPGRQLSRQGHWLSLTDCKPNGKPY